MIKRAVYILILILLIGLATAPVIAAKASPYSLQIKKLFSAPDEDSNLIYNIPVTVKILDISGDANWYKVEISYNLGPLHYTYQGWTEIPVGSILAERELNSTGKVAAAE